MMSFCRTSQKLQIKNEIRNGWKCLNCFFYLVVDKLLKIINMILQFWFSRNHVLDVNKEGMPKNQGCFGKKFYFI